MRVSIIGLGYVGVPLLVEFAESGLDVTGIDIDAEKTAILNSGRSYISDVPDSMIERLVAQGNVRATTDYAVLKAADAVCICVPTPLGKSKTPDISYIVNAVERIREHLHPGMLVVLESTTYPGTTEEVVLPILEETGLKAGRDFFLAFSPERVDPANERYGIKNTPKVIGGTTPACTEKAMALYRHAVDKPVPVSSARSAEMVKLLENTFRAINIGMVNELAVICDHLNVDVWEVIDAAATKPFGFMPFYPGPGLGGHCIPVDPLYLSWKLKTINYDARFIELASNVNSNMPRYVVDRITEALNDVQKCIKGSRILLLGVAYKRDVSDVRESAALDIIDLLRKKRADVSYLDPWVPVIRLGDNSTLSSIGMDVDLSTLDLVVIVTDHRAFDYQKIVQETSLILDTRNALGGLDVPGTCRVIRL